MLYLFSYKSNKVVNATCLTYIRQSGVTTENKQQAILPSVAMVLHIDTKNVQVRTY